MVVTNAPLPKRRLAQEALQFLGVTAVLGLLVFMAVGGGPPLEKGLPAPPTRGLTLDGAAFDLADWKGQYVFVNVWATWCAPCIQELPDLARASQKWPRIRFVGLAAESTHAAVALMASRFALPYPVVEIDEVVARGWNTNALPSSYLVAPGGLIEWSATGALGPAALDQVMRRADTAR